MIPSRFFNRLVTLSVCEWLCEVPGQVQVWLRCLSTNRSVGQCSDKVLELRGVEKRLYQQCITCRARTEESVSLWGAEESHQKNRLMFLLLGAEAGEGQCGGMKDMKPSVLVLKIYLFGRHLLI